MSLDREHNDSGNSEFVIERIFSASRDLVWNAWTKRDELVQWFGPEGFTNPECAIDLRAGGAFTIVMKSREGICYPIKGRYSEVTPPEPHVPSRPGFLVYEENLEEYPRDWHKLLYDNLGEGNIMHEKGGSTIVKFEDHDGRTKLTVRTRFESTAVRDAFIRMGLEAGWRQSFDKLEGMLPHKPLHHGVVLNPTHDQKLP